MFQETHSNNTTDTTNEVNAVNNNKEEAHIPTKMTTEKLLVPSKVQKVTKLVPPDGGWGWMVLIGTALSNVSIFMHKL